MTRQRWQKLMRALQLQDHCEIYTQLCVVYAQKHRFYHTGKHIEACLHSLDEVSDLADNPNEIELALWFHDAIYKPYSANNEVKSADWAAEFLQKNAADQKLIQRIHQLIMVTVHSVPADTKDTSLMVDIDLSILGKSPQIYAQFETAIRKEYKMVPYFIYREKRIEILESFLNRTTIYQQKHFQTLFEAQARQNIQHAISSL